MKDYFVQIFRAYPLLLFHALCLFVVMRNPNLYASSGGSGGGNGPVRASSLTSIEASIFPTGLIECEQGCIFKKATESLLLQIAVERSELERVLDPKIKRAEKAKLLQGHCAQGTIDDQCEKAFVLFKTHRIQKLKKAILQSQNSTSELVSEPGAKAVQKAYPDDQKVQAVLPILPTLEELQAIENLRFQNNPISPDQRKSLLKSFALEALAPPRMEDYVVTEVRKLKGDSLTEDSLIVIKKTPEGKPVLDAKAYADAVKRYEALKKTFIEDGSRKNFLTEILPEKAKMLDIRKAHTYVKDGETEKSYLNGRSLILEAAERAVGHTQPKDPKKASAIQTQGNQRSPATPADPNRPLVDRREDTKGGNVSVTPGDYLNSVEAEVQSAYESVNISPD